MQEASKKQKQVNAILLQTMGEVFLKLGLTTCAGALVTIKEVDISPDLANAKVVYTCFPTSKQSLVADAIKKNEWQIKKNVVEIVKNQLRRIPHFVYLSDDRLDYVFHMEEVFKKI